MSPHHAAQFREALEAIDLICGVAGGWMPVWLERDGHAKRWWHRAGSGGRVLADLVQRRDELYSDEILLGVPCERRWEEGPHRASILWCRVEGKEQLRRARALRPLPSLVLQEGSSSRRLLIWSLRKPLGYFHVEQANKRIAYKVGAVQKHAVPESLRIPAPGTCLRVGRARPIPVVVSRLETVSYTPRQVVGRLKDPPVVNWWEQAK